MAHRILGLDLGAHAIKLAIVDKTLRQTVLSGWDVEPVAADAPEAQRIDAIRTLLQRNLRSDDVVAVGLPTAVCMHRTLSFPFRDDKAIAEAVGFELENHIPTPLAELAVDHVRVNSPTPRDDGQTEVIAFAAPQVEVERWIERLRTAGSEPRRLGVTALVYASLVRALPELKSGTTLLVDVGVQGAEVVVTVEGETQYLRSLSTGAAGVAETLARQLQVAPAEDLLATHARLLPQGTVPESQEERQAHDATVAALAPLLRELRQTLGAWLRKSRTKPDRLVLTGGLGKLSGLHEFCEQALGLPVLPVRLEQLPEVRLAEADQLGDTAALAVAQALASAEGRPDQDVDFRQGELAYEGDFKVLRARLPQLAAFLVVALCLLAVRTSLQWRTLVSEQDLQLKQLSATSKSLTGKRMEAFDELRRELKREPSVDLLGYYPELSAFKAMEEVAKIVDRVTEPPDFQDAPPAPGTSPGVQPPGPAEAEPPGSGEIADRAVRLRMLQQAEGAAAPLARPNLEPPGPTVAPPGVGPGSNPAPDTPPAAVAAPLRAPAAPTDAGRATDDGSEKPATSAVGHHQVELASMQIERTSGTLRGDADTQEALLALQQAIDAHRCFAKAKSTSDKITFERHNGWYKFTLQFEIACPQNEGKSGKSRAGKDGGEKAEGDKSGSEKSGSDKADSDKADSDKPAGKAGKTDGEEE
jgi:type IV pilus assembly protein PilM